MGVSTFLAVHEHEIRMLILLHTGNMPLYMGCGITDTLSKSLNGHCSYGQAEQLWWAALHAETGQIETCRFIVQ